MLAIAAITAATQGGKALGSTSCLHPSLLCRSLAIPGLSAQPAHAALLLPASVHHLVQGTASTHLSAVSPPVREGGPC